MHSIRRTITLVLVSSLILVIFSAAIHGYRAALSMSSRFMDQELTTLLYSVSISHGQQAEGLGSSELVYQIWRNGELITDSPNQPDQPLTLGDDGFSEQNFAGKRWRVYKQTLVDNTIVIVAQPLQSRVGLTDSLTVSVIMPFLYAVPILALIVFVSVSLGLKPLKLLSQKLSHRKGKDLSPVSLPHVPEEMQPVMDTLNTMFSRLNEAFEREQQFASNAAHELRTPLSVMKINLHNLAKERQEDEGKLKAIQQDTDRMIHVVNQILLLSRTSPEMFHLQLSKVDAFLVAQNVITDIYSKIESKQQDISLEGDSALLMSTEFTLYTMLQNLIANASAYSPEGAAIQVSVQAQDGQVLLMVEDSGPGIAPQERPQVLKRFYRDQKDEKYKSTGSGLGLAIVGQIVTLHHGTITLDESSLGGLCVTIRLPFEVIES
ncbi:sensor histidine kinase [Alteromonas lipolytica]|uniref:histidine kinase n=1 Tax=Alteromonas lipolytica TaxID=1856405 RepID=A0A1E8FB56_9ALTE|nr:ATP-binding protein [Alteromonas lipolytica]OFI33016.1 two-component sensor histidine kinase [Alteromonas lipolytica]GGF63301.1 two-component sensor histidine kinase [Alteromonas lipolytica]